MVENTEAQLIICVLAPLEFGQFVSKDPLEVDHNNKIKIIKEIQILCYIT